MLFQKHVTPSEKEREGSERMLQVRSDGRGDKKNRNFGVTYFREAEEKKLDAIKVREPKSNKFLNNVGRCCSEST